MKKALCTLLVAAMIARAAWRVFLRAESTFTDRARLSVDDVAEVCLAVEGALVAASRLSSSTKAESLIAMLQWSEK